MKISIRFAPKIDDSIVTHDGKIKINFAPSEINKKEIKMKYEVIGTYPHSKFCLGDIIVSNELGGFYFDKKDPCIWRSTDIVFANYPLIFKPIEDKPKWIDKQMIVAEISSAATPRCATIEIHKNGLYTKEDMIEFSIFCLQWRGTPDMVRFNEWIDKKSNE